MTPEANVWSFAVTLWELVSLGEQPYPGMTDREVIDQVLVKKEVKPSIPTTTIKDKERMYEIMQLCMGEQTQRPTMAEAYKLLQHLQESPFELDEFDEKWNKLLPKSDSIVERLQEHGSPNFPMKFENGDGDVEEEVGGDRSRLSTTSITQGFEIDNKTGFIADDADSDKMIMNPSFEEDDDDITQFIDEVSPRKTSNEVIVDLSAELDKDVTKIEMNGIETTVEEKTQKESDVLLLDTADPITDSDSRPKRDSFRNSVHMMVSESVSEDHVDIELDQSRSDSFLTADTNLSRSPDVFQATGDFDTPIGSLDTESHLREIERSEDEIVMMGRARVSSGSESERDVPSPLKPRVSSDSDEGSSGSASERVSKFLSNIEPPPYSPSKSPGLANNEFDFDDNQPWGNGSDSEDGAKEDVVIRRKHGTAANPMQRSGVIEGDVDLPESGFLNLKDIDANAHIHHVDAEEGLDENGEDEGDKREMLLTGSDGKMYRRKSSIRQSDQNLSFTAGAKRVSFTDKEHLVEVHTYPKDGSGSDGDDEDDEAKPAYLSILESIRKAKVKKGSNESENTAKFFNTRGNRNAVIIDFDASAQRDEGKEDTEAKPNDLDDDMAMLIM